MIEEIKQKIEELKNTVPTTLEDVEKIRIATLGKKGVLNQYFAAFKEVAPDQKKAYGQIINLLKNTAEAKVEEWKNALSGSVEKGEAEDFSRPSEEFAQGAVHPLTSVRNEIVEIFSRIGFSVSEGPEIEDDWHNFSALNFPEEHPARDMQDTFFVEKDPDWALRTHTSSVQVRVMEGSKPPIRTISPGRVFRNEDISSRSHCVFHQIEGLYIDKGVSFADLKQTLLYFAQEFFGKEAKIRMRPSYFPFTEPSAEVDVYWGLETEADYRITKGTGWLEIMGCGMVDPEVLRASNIDPEEYSGYAFGMGIERIAMNRFGITDIRMFYENDMRFLSQFSSNI